MRARRLLFRGRGALACGLAAALAVGAGGAAAEEFSHSHALVIGISDYADPVWPDLSFAERDGRALAAFLKSQDFQVIELYNAEATRDRILTAMEDELPARIASGDRVVLFYSGHGHTRSFDGTDFGYIVPHDAGTGTGSMIAMDSLRIWSQKISAARHQLFLMDACFGGLLAPKASALPVVRPDHPDYIREIVRRDARQYLTAGGRDQQVLDGGPKGYSYFTGYLLEALEDGLGDVDGDGYITASELAGYLIPRATNPYQTPGAGTLPGHGLGDFVFRAPQAGGPTRTETATFDAPAKGQPQIAARPPEDAAIPDEDSTRGGGAGSIAAAVAARGDEAREAMTRLIRETAYGQLGTALVRSIRTVEIIADGPERAVLEVEYLAVNRRVNYQDLRRETVAVRIEDGRLVFEKATR